MHTQVCKRNIRDFLGDGASSVFLLWCLVLVFVNWNGKLDDSEVRILLCGKIENRDEVGEKIDL